MLLTLRRAAIADLEDRPFGARHPPAGDGRRHLAGARPPVGPLAEHDLMADHPERPDIRRHAGPSPAHQLGRHIRDRAAMYAGRSHERIGGQAEIRQHHPPVRHAQDVLRRDIAVQDAGRVDGGEARGRARTSAIRSPSGRRAIAPELISSRNEPCEVSSMIRKTWPSACAKSKTRQTLGWWICRASLTSRASRSAQIRSPVYSARTILMATASPSVRSSASATTPMPPRPITLRIS
jgi:hypothetical protein